MTNEHQDDSVVDSYSDAQVLDIGQHHGYVDIFDDETKPPPSLHELSHAIATNPLTSEQPQASSGDVEVRRTKKASESSTSNEDQKPKRDLKCRFCPMTFSKSQALGGHMNRHRQEREQEQYNHAKKLIMAQHNTSQYGAWNTLDNGHVNLNPSGYVMPPQPSMFSSSAMYHPSQPNMNMQNQQDVYVPQAPLQCHHGINMHGPNDTRAMQGSSLQDEFLPSGAYGRQMNATSGSTSTPQMQMHPQQASCGPYDNLHTHNVMPNYGMEEQYAPNLQLNKQSIFQLMEGTNQSPYIKAPKVENTPPPRLQRYKPSRNDSTDHFVPADSLGQVVEHGPGKSDGRNVKPRTMRYQGSHDGNTLHIENFHAQFEQVNQELGTSSQPTLMNYVQEFGEDEHNEDNTIIGPESRS